MYIGTCIGINNNLLVSPTGCWLWQCGSCYMDKNPRTKYYTFTALVYSCEYHPLDDERSPSLMEVKLLPTSDILCKPY